MPALAAAVVVLKGVTLVLGGLITYYSFRAYARTRSESLRALTVGFGVVTLGALLAGIADTVLFTDSRAALLVESTFTALGFGFLFYSLFAD